MNTTIRIMYEHNKEYYRMPVLGLLIYTIVECKPLHKSTVCCISSKEGAIFFLGDRRGYNDSAVLGRFRDSSVDLQCKWRETIHSAHTYIALAVRAVSRTVLIKALAGSNEATHTDFVCKLLHY